MSRSSSRHFSDHIYIQRQYFPVAIKIKGQRPIRAMLDAQFAPDAFLTVVDKHSLSYFLRLKLATGSPMAMHAFNGRHGDFLAILHKQSIATISPGFSKIIFVKWEIGKIILFSSSVTLKS